MPFDNQSPAPSAVSPGSNLPSTQMKRRRVPNDERKRTAMSCDRCKARKIKVLYFQGRLTKCVDPQPGPCMYCASSGYECKITLHRKQRPFYYASEEQYRWLQIIASKIRPGANLTDINQLKEIAKSLDGNTKIKTEDTAYDNDTDRAGTGPDIPINVDQEEGMEGVVDGIGTLMIDNMGRQSKSILPHLIA
jgi:hypothetical protein